METIYFSGGCLWGVQEFMKHLPGVERTQAGRVNGATHSTKTAYDGYGECVKMEFDPAIVSLETLIDYLFEIIDPYSINKQGNDVGEKYRTGIYSKETNHLLEAKCHIERLENALNDKNRTRKKVAVEVLPFTNYIPSDNEHQDRLTLFPDDYCHIPLRLLHKYKKKI